MKPLARLLVSIAAVSITACQTLDSPTAPAVAASLPPPPACSANLPGDAPRLTLPRTESPRLASAAASTGGNLDIAQVHTVNRALPEVGVWQKREQGWSVLALQIGSEGARGLAVRLRDLQLPTQSEAWLCAPDGSKRAGPFRDTPSGELWTPGLPGAQVRLEVWVPTTQREQFDGFLADVYGAYR